MNASRHALAAVLALAAATIGVAARGSDGDVAARRGAGRAAPAGDVLDRASAPLEEAWRHHVGPATEFTAVAVDGDAIAYAERRDHVDQAALVLAAADGGVRWRVRSPGGFGRPHLVGNLVVVSHDAGIGAFSRTGGGHVWQVGAAQGLDSLDVESIGHGDGLVLVTVRVHDAAPSRTDLVALRAGDGTVMWRAPLPGPTSAAPAIAAGVVVVPYEDGRAGRAGVVAYDAAGGVDRWHRALPPGPTGGVGVAAGVVAVVCGDMAARGIDLATGEVRWAVDVASRGSAGVAPVAVARPGGGVDVLVATRMGSMHLLDPATGIQRWASGQVGAAVDGDPVASPDGRRFAIPLYRGSVAVAGMRGPARTIDPPGLLSHVGVTADGLLVTSSYDGAPDDAVVAYRNW